MTKRGNTRVKAKDFLGKKAEEGLIEIEFDEDTVFTIQPMESQPDEFIDAQADNDLRGMVQVALGDQYEDYRKAGGTIMLAVGAMKNAWGDTLGN